MRVRTRGIAWTAGLPVLAAIHAVSAAAQPGDGVLRGRLVPADGGDVRAVRVSARAGPFAAAAGVDSAGRFTLPVPVGIGGDSLELRVDAAEGAARAYHPALVRVHRDAAGEHEVVLVPLRWTVAGGRHAAEEVEVRLERAFRPPCERCSGFWRRADLRADTGRAVVHGWPDERFPLRIAFDREWSGVQVTARDSAVFWREARELEEVFGAVLFRPARYAETLPRGDEEAHDVILVWFDPELRGISGLGSAVSVGHDIEFGDLRLGRRALTADGVARGLVAHELMHTLGFGHTCAWRSVMADVRRCPELRADAATAEDVAYVQLAARIRALQRERSGRWGLEAALAAESAGGSGLAMQ